MARKLTWRLPRVVQPTQTKSYPATTSFMIPPLQPTWTRRDAVRFAEEGYRRNVIAYRAVSMIATAAAYVPLKLTERRVRGGRRVVGGMRC
jgi:phage portal protein BeeE